MKKKKNTHTHDKRPFFVTLNLMLRHGLSHYFITLVAETNECVFWECLGGKTHIHG